MVPVKIDLNRRPVSALKITNGVIFALQRTPGARVRLALKIEANAESSFDNTEVGIVRDNA